MSNIINDILLDEAREVAENNPGMWARVIDRDIAANDLDALKYHIAEAHREEAIQEDTSLTERDYEIAEQLRDEMRDDGIKI